MKRLVSAVLVILMCVVTVAQPRPKISLDELRETVEKASRRGENVTDILRALEAFAKALGKAAPGEAEKNKDVREKFTALREAVEQAERKGEDVGAILKELNKLEIAADPIDDKKRKEIVARLIGSDKESLPDAINTLVRDDGFRELSQREIADFKKAREVCEVADHKISVRGLIACFRSHFDFIEFCDYHENFEYYRLHLANETSGDEWAIEISAGTDLEGKRLRESISLLHDKKKTHPTRSQLVCESGRRKQLSQFFDEADVLKHIGKLVVTPEFTNKNLVILRYHPAP